MKLLLGDNQFFGVNHSNLEKAMKTKELFNTEYKITNFINKSLDLGLDGFMINSNDLGFKVIEEFDFSAGRAECHYSIPYPHKYAGLINDYGMISLLSVVLRQLNFTDIFHLMKFVFTFNASFLLPIIIRMEIPKALPKGSVVYLQNIVTDLIMGLKNGDKVLSSYITSIKSMGYKPGLITLNVEHLYNLLGRKHDSDELHLCFNINNSGFNVFPSISRVESIIKKAKKTTKWKLMAMSIFSSGSQGISIEESINFIKLKELDYVVFGSSNLKNIESNKRLFGSRDNSRENVAKG